MSDSIYLFGEESFTIRQISSKTSDEITAVTSPSLEKVPRSPLTSGVSECSTTYGTAEDAQGNEELDGSDRCVMSPVALRNRPS